VSAVARPYGLWSAMATTLAAELPKHRARLDLTVPLPDTDEYRIVAPNYDRARHKSLPAVFVIPHPRSDEGRVEHWGTGRRSLTVFPVAIDVVLRDRSGVEDDRLRDIAAYAEIIEQVVATNPTMGTSYAHVETSAGLVPEYLGAQGVAQTFWGAAWRGSFRVDGPELLTRNTYSIALDGVDGYLNIPYAASWDITGASCSLSLWAKTTNLTQAGKVIASVGYSTAIGWPKLVLATSAAGDGRLTATISTGGAQTSITSSVALTSGAWTHILVAWRDSDDAFEMWGNGSSIASGSAAGTLDAAPNGPLRYGSSSDVAGDFFDGSIDEPAWIDDYLDGDDAAALYHLGVPRCLLLPEAYYDRTDHGANALTYHRFSEGTGTTAEDLTGSGNTATLAGGATWSTSAPGS